MPRVQGKLWPETVMTAERWRQADRIVQEIAPFVETAAEQRSRLQSEGVDNDDDQ